MTSRLPDRRCFHWPVVGWAVQCLAFVAHLSAKTVQPSLRVPGTAGTGFFQPIPAITAAFLLLIGCVVFAGNALTAIQFCGLFVVATIVQRALAAISRWRGGHTQPGFVGRSILHLIWPTLSRFHAYALGEGSLCLLAGTVAALLGDRFLGSCLALAGLSTFVSFWLTEPEDFAAMRIAPDPWLASPPRRRGAKRIRCRVIGEGDHDL